INRKNKRQFNFLPLVKYLYFIFRITPTIDIEPKLFNHNSLISYSLIIILIIYLIIKLKCNILCNNKNILLLLFQDSIIKKNGAFSDKNSKKRKRN
ncbi:hypothetical protein, partial [Ruminococcus sp.]|uniref:hypothetical protein n=1 Tax=Ruminococcus sp. TaxID=41978 RepID=UPI0025E518F1